MSSSVARRQRRLDRKVLKGVKSDTIEAEDIHDWFSSQHEAAHTVVALAVGAEIERVYLEPKPQTLVLWEGLDTYQMAAITIAGPLTDYALGMTPGPLDPDYLEWLDEPPTKDWLMYSSCCWGAVGLEQKPIVGFNSEGLPLSAPPSREELDEHGPALEAWDLAARMITAHLCKANSPQIAKLAGALMRNPAGLSSAEVRAVTGSLTVLSQERLHDSIDDLALRGLDAGAVAFAEHKKLLSKMTYKGWGEHAALKVVERV
jgi:hypothetical protein